MLETSGDGDRVMGTSVIICLPDWYFAILMQNVA